MSELNLDDILDSALDEFEADKKIPSTSSTNLNNIDILNNPTQFIDSLKSLVSDMSKDGSINTSDIDPMMNSLNQLASNLDKIPSENVTSIPPVNTTASLEQSIEKMMQSVAQNAKESKTEAASNPFAGMNGMDENFDMSKMDDMFKSMFGDMNNAGADGGMDKMMADMMSSMQSLFNKDMMKQPMVDITLKYPAYLENSKGKISDTDYNLFEKQYNCFQRIVDEINKPGDDMTKIMDLMQEMQNYGSPPKEILDDLMPGMDPTSLMNMGANGGMRNIPNMPNLPPPGVDDFDPKKMEEMCKTQ